MWVKIQDAYTQQYCCFQLIKVSFYNYPLISIHDRIPRTLSLSLTCLNMPADKIVTQTNIVVQFISRSLGHLGETPGCLAWHLHQVFVCHQLSTNCILSLQIQHHGWLCLLFPGLQLVGQWFLSLWGHLDICPLLCQLHVTSITQLELSSPTSLKAWEMQRNSAVTLPSS